MGRWKLRIWGLRIWRWGSLGMGFVDLGVGVEVCSYFLEG